MRQVLAGLIMLLLVASASAQSTVYKRDDIQVLWITLTIDGEDSLLIVLGRDGLVNRQGTGIAGKTQKALYIGKHSGIFKEVLNSVDEDFLQYMGAYKAKKIKGSVCRLTVNFEFSGKKTHGFVWKYGLESQGPPRELTQVVIKAIEMTEPHYQAVLENSP